jgi:hypothetical protein
MRAATETSGPLDVCLLVGYCDREVRGACLTYPPSLFREPARLHVHPLPGDGLYPFLEELPGLRSRPLNFGLVMIAPEHRPLDTRAVRLLSR